MQSSIPLCLCVPMTVYNFQPNFFIYNYYIMFILEPSVVYLYNTLFYLLSTQLLNKLLLHYLSDCNMFQHKPVIIRLLIYVQS
jgi:hypothetical protein